MGSGTRTPLRVYLQVPNKGTEFFPHDERAKQAAPGYHNEVEAMKTFYRHGSTVTPALLAIKEDVQDSQGFVPDGYVIYIVFERVPGVRLADNRILPGWGALFIRFSKGLTTPSERKFECVLIRSTAS